MRIKNIGRWIVAGAVLGQALVPATWAAPVTGVAVNGLNGQPERGVEVEIEGTEVRATSDVDGLVSLQLDPGTHVARITKNGFKTQRVTGIVVGEAGGDFAVVLTRAGSAAGDDVVVEEEITITAEADLATEAALLAERKGAVQISDSIGSEEMSKNTGSDAAGVLKRVTGISLQENKFVYVRGLGDRYSSTALNGSKIPSTEFEKKVIPLDLFPADLIDKITVSKSYTVDKPGDFAAGLVELSTVDFPSNQSASIGFSAGWNSETTGDPWLEYPGGVGFSGSGGQPLPSTIPDGDLVRFSPFSNTGFTADELESFGEALIGDWRGVRDDSAPFNGTIKGSYGNTVHDGRLGFVVTGTYENKVNTRDEERNFFRIGAGDVVEPDNTYRFDYSDEKVRQAITGNLAYRLGANHHLQFRSLFTSLSEAEGRFQEGFFSDVGANIENFRVSFLEQDITSFQLTGDHYFNGLGGGALLEWRASVSDASTDENRRETLYEESIPGVFSYTDASQSGFMYFNALEDEVNDLKIDWSSFFQKGDVFGTLKAGVAYTVNDREFDGRRLRFFTRRSRGLDFTLPPEELFSEDNIRPDGFEIIEATRPTDTYLGEHDVPAAYVQADVARGRWRLIGGVRVEDSEQDVITFDRNSPSNEPIFTHLADTDVLPSLSVVYKLGDDTNLRFSASQTVNRPEYRELAPFEFTHIVGGFTAVGNPELQRAKITSVDARWEWFPSANEVIAASVFWKDFEDPIEKLLLGGSLNFETFTNVEEARNFGFELEARKDLGTLSEALKGFMVVFNYAFVESEITIDPSVSAVTNDQRALVGQPDNVANLIFEWTGQNSGSSVRLLYNFIDDRVAFAGGFGLPDVIEESRSTVDVVWSQQLDRWVSGLKLKVSGTNLTDEARSWTQGGGIFRFYDPGRSIGLSFSYNPFAR